MEDSDSEKINLSLYRNLPKEIKEAVIEEIKFQYGEKVNPKNFKNEDRSIIMLFAWRPRGRASNNRIWNEVYRGKYNIFKMKNNAYKRPA